MVTVLLAIDSDTPNQTVFNYAVQFCRRMKAKLDVLHIIKPQRNKRKNSAQDTLPQADLQTQYSEPFIHYQPSLQADDPDQAVASYVRSHRNVVLTIYDTRRRKSALFKKKGGRKPQTFYPLLVPLVIVRRGHM